MVGTKRLFRWIAVSSLVVLYLGLLGLTGGVEAEDREEIILEGEDRRSTKSAFEYEEGDTTSRDRVMPSTDIPSARYDERNPDPVMKKKMQTKRENVDNAKETKLKDKGSTWKWPIIIGGVAVLLVIAG